MWTENYFFHYDCLKPFFSTSFALRIREEMENFFFFSAVINHSLFLEMWSHLQMFGKFSPLKSSHFNGNPRDLEFRMRAKDFPTQIVQHYKLFALVCQKAAWFESEFCVSCVGFLLCGSICSVVHRCLINFAKVWLHLSSEKLNHSVMRWSLK